MRCVYCGLTASNDLYVLNGNSCCTRCVESKKIKLHGQEAYFTLLVEIKQLKEQVVNLEKKLNKKHHKSSKKKEESEQEKQATNINLL